MELLVGVRRGHEGRTAIGFQIGLMAVLFCLTTPISAQKSPAPNPGVVEALRRGLSCPDAQIRSATLSLLRKEKQTKIAKSLVPEIVRLLGRESHPLLRREAVQTLTALETPESLGALHSLISNPDSAIRLEAVKGLGTLGDHTSLPLLAKRLFDIDPSIRREAGTQLAKVSDRARRGVPSPVRSGR